MGMGIFDFSPGNSGGSETAPLEPGSLLEPRLETRPDPEPRDHSRGRGGVAQASTSFAHFPRDAEAQLQSIYPNIQKMTVAAGGGRRGTNVECEPRGSRE